MTLAESSLKSTSFSKISHLCEPINILFCLNQVATERLLNNSDINLGIPRAAVKLNEEAHRVTADSTLDRELQRDVNGRLCIGRYWQDLTTDPCDPCTKKTSETSRNFFYLLPEMPLWGLCDIGGKQREVWRVLQNLLKI